MPGIDELLNALQNPNTSGKNLPNTFETWSRIGAKDSFAELGLSRSELDAFLEEWIAENDYDNIR